MNPFRKRSVGWLLGAVCCGTARIFLAGIAQAEIPSSLEPLYSEAVLAYNAAETNRALKLIDELQRQNPNIPEALELKALILKSNEPKKAADVYRELIRVKIGEKKSAREIAPYYFEIGMLKFEAKEYPEARTFFQRSADSGFNASASHFFLGNIAFLTNDSSKADEHFNAVAKGDVTALKAPALFFLAQIYMKQNQSGKAISYISAARDQSKEVMDDTNTSADNRKVSTQIYEAATKALQPLDKSSFFGNASLMSGYDSNILSLPDSVSSSGASGKKTVKGVVQAGLGYTTSPLRKWQWVPNYRIIYNHNFNKDSRSAEYLIQTLSLYATHRPLNPFNYGLKIEGTHTFQNSVDPTTDKGTYRPLSLNGSFGPFIRNELKPRLILGAEVLFEPQHYYTDNKQTSNSKLSGDQIQARSYLQYDRGTKYFNPTGFVSLLRNNTDGTDFRAYGVTLGFSNAFYFKEKLRLQGSLDFGLTSYPDRSGQTRSDKTLNFGLTSSYKINSRLSAIGDGKFTWNNSNIKESYDYKRFTLLVGVSYSLI